MKAREEIEKIYIGVLIVLRPLFLLRSLLRSISGDIGKLFRRKGMMNSNYNFQYIFKGRSITSNYSTSGEFSRVVFIYVGSYLILVKCCCGSLGALGPCGRKSHFRNNVNSRQPSAGRVSYLHVYPSSNLYRDSLRSTSCSCRTHDC